MSRATPPRGRTHAAAQRRYQAWRLRRFLRPNVRDGEIAFDVGANDGEWAAEMRRLGATVIAVEPQAECVAELRARFDRDQGVRVVDKAVGREEGEGVLQLATTGSAHASMSAEWRENAVAHRGMAQEAWAGTERVKVTTLDALIDEFGVPAFCKIDVEGLEPDVLGGLSQPLGAVTFEFHKEMVEPVEECVRLLAELGPYRYRIFLDEWPRKFGRELEPDAVPAAVAGLPTHAWGMILAIKSRSPRRSSPGPRR
jgi:FkbM family methyltransferase